MLARFVPVLLAGSTAAVYGLSVWAQSDSKDIGVKYRTFLPGQIQVSHTLASAFYVIDNNIFTCTPIEGPRTEGAVLAAVASEDQTWSISTMSLLDGTTSVQYPVYASVQTPSGERRSLLPGTLKFKVDIKPGEVLHSTGNLFFDVTTRQPIKAGSSMSVLVLNYVKSEPSILSVAAADGQPTLSAFLRNRKPGGRGADIDAWRIVRDHVLHP
jgi:hypothetical protein